MLSAAIIRCDAYEKNTLHSALYRCRRSCNWHLCLTQHMKTSKGYSRCHFSTHAYEMNWLDDRLCKSIQARQSPGRHLCLTNSRLIRALAGLSLSLILTRHLQLHKLTKLLKMLELLKLTIWTRIRSTCSTQHTSAHTSRIHNTVHSMYVLQHNLPIHHPRLFLSRIPVHLPRRPQREGAL